MKKILDSSVSRQYIMTEDSIEIFQSFKRDLDLFIYYSCKSNFASLSLEDQFELLNLFYNSFDIIMLEFTKIKTYLSEV